MSYVDSVYEMNAYCNFIVSPTKLQRKRTFGKLLGMQMNNATLQVLNVDFDL